MLEIHSLIKLRNTLDRFDTSILLLIFFYRKLYIDARYLYTLFYNYNNDNNLDDICDHTKRKYVIC